MLIGYVMAVISLLFGFVCIRICHKFLNPGTLFCFIWGMIFFLSSLQLFDLNPSKNITFVRLGIGVLCFIVGYLGNCCLWKKLRFKFISKNRNLRERTGSLEEYIPNYKYIIFYIIIVYMIFDKIAGVATNIELLLNGSNLTSILFAAREASINMRGTIRNVITNLITNPATYVVYPMCAYNILYKKKKVLTLLVIILIVFGLLTNGSRSLLIYFGIALLCAYSFSKEDAAIRTRIRNSLKRRKKYFKWVIAGGIIFFMFISYLRSGQALLKDSYYYFAMQPTMFEQWSEIADKREVYGHGLASFNGFTFPPLYIFTNIFQVDYPEHWDSVYRLIQLTDSSWRHITTTGIIANAYVSAFWFFYVDARTVGIALISLFYGIVCSKYFLRTLNNPSMKNICIYSMILFSVFDTYVRMRFTRGDFVLGYLLLHFFLFKKGKRKENGKDLVDCSSVQC